MKNNLPKSIFVTFNKIGYACLEELISSQLNELVCVYSLKKELTKNLSDYKDPETLTSKNNIKLKLINNINNHLKEIKTLKPDIIFVIGWSQIIKPEIIKLPPLGCVGFHPALLPRNRGRAAIAWHFINEDEYGGATIFYINEGCDSGDIICQKKFEINLNDNALTYYNKALNIAADLFQKNLDLILKNKVKAIKQDESKANYLLIRREDDSFIDFERMNAGQIFNQVRAVAYLYPTAYANYKKEKILFYEAKTIPKEKDIYSATLGQIIKTTNNSIWVKTNDGIIELCKIQDKNNNPIDIPAYFKVGHHLNR